MLSSTMHNFNTYPSVFLLSILTFLIFPISSNSQTDPAGPQINYCVFTYNSNFYVFGDEGNNNHPYFVYTNTPFDVTSSPWNFTPVANATKVFRPACSVTSDGILYVTGGVDIDNGKYIVQSIDLKSSILGSRYTRQCLSNQCDFKSIVVKTSSEEVLFIFGGSESNDASILNVRNLTWETVPNGPDASFIDVHAITSFEDNIYIIGTPTKDSGKSILIWAFNIPKRSWFSLDTTVNLFANDQNAYAGIQLINSDDLSFSVWKWNLANNSATFLGTNGYPFAQLADVLIVYNGDYDSLAVFNMTKNAWVIQVNNATGSKSLPNIIGAVGVLVVLVGMGLFLHGRTKNKKKNGEQPAIAETDAASESSIETGSQRDNSEICQLPTLEVSGLQNEHYSFLSDTTINMNSSLIYQSKIEHCSFLSDTTVVSDFSTSPTSHRTVKLNSTPPPPSSRISELYTQYKVTTITFTASPSAQSDAIIFNKYKLSGGMPTYDVKNSDRNSVRRAEDETMHENVAVKFFSNKDSFEREVVMLKHLRSEFVCALRDVFDISNWKYAMVMDYYPMSLDNFIISRTGTTDKLYVKIVVKSLAQAISYVHSHEIVHLDIKPGNFVHEVGDVNKWRLIDFEAARVNGEEDVDSSTLRYASPEIINAATLHTSIKADTSMDMWSLGCTMYEVYTGSPLFPNEQEANDKLFEAYDTKHLELPLDNVEDIQARHVLEKLLVINPMKRASVGEILRGAYFHGGADSIQIYNLQSESEKIINILNQRS
ncbi:10312_t:CDS:2 [Paraglomus brasilianum]|uniref:10312_t:CDS:1 n=1 Tax=Paraglomus brasilianum TaxID=144538 RepID=A0A9N9EWG9_9GLOM|nr:10312_t:CDS:2 [Paraglomus brasilianum]